MILNWKTTYFPVLGVNISQTVRTAVARLPLHQLGRGFLVNISLKCKYRVVQKVIPQFSFCDNFRKKCTPILTIFSLLEQEMYGA